jgi:hypothetical protein
MISIRNTIGKINILLDFYVFMFTRYIVLFRRVIVRHVHSTRIVRPLNIVFFGSDLFSQRILEHLHRSSTTNQLFIQQLEVITTLSSTNLIRSYTDKHQLTTHIWPDVDSFVSKTSKQFDLGIVASFGQLLPRHVIESFPL